MHPTAVVRFVWKFFDGKRARDRRARGTAETLSAGRGEERSLWNGGAREWLDPTYHHLRRRRRPATAERTSVAPLYQQGRLSVRDPRNGRWSTRSVGGDDARLLRKEDPVRGLIPWRNRARGDRTPLGYCSKESYLSRRVARSPLLRLGRRDGWNRPCCRANPSPPPAPSHAGGGCFKISGWCGGVMP